jgi:hypothetical protein
VLLELGFVAPSILRRCLLSAHSGVLAVVGTERAHGSVGSV